MVTAQNMLYGHRMCCMVTECAVWSQNVLYLKEGLRNVSTPNGYGRMAFVVNKWVTNMAASCAVKLK